MTPLISLKAVLFATLLSLSLRFTWYQVLFSDTWISLLAKKQAFQKRTYIWVFFTSAFTAFIMAHIIKFTYSDDLSKGFEVGFWVWAAFYLAPLFARFKFEHSPLKLFLIDVGFHFFEIVGMGIILALAQ